MLKAGAGKRDQNEMSKDSEPQMMGDMSACLLVLSNAFPSIIKFHQEIVVGRPAQDIEFPTQWTKIICEKSSNKKGGRDQRCIRRALHNIVEEFGA